MVSAIDAIKSGLLLLEATASFAARGGAGSQKLGELAPGESWELERFGLSPDVTGQPL